MANMSTYYTLHSILFPYRNSNSTAPLITSLLCIFLALDLVNEHLDSFLPHPNKIYGEALDLTIIMLNLNSIIEITKNPLLAGR